MSFLHLGDFRVVEDVQSLSDQPVCSQLFLNKEHNGDFEKLAQIGIGMMHHEWELIYKIYLGLEKLAGISSLTPCS